MPNNDGINHHLTTSNLALHDQLLEQNLIVAPVPWVEKVIKAEQVHQFYSSSQTRIFEPRDLNDALRDMERWTVDSFLLRDQTIECLKLFEPGQGMCLESPLERFLTPDGCSVPSYFDRSALEQIEIRFGSMDGRRERKERARENVDLVVRNRDQSKSKSMTGNSHLTEYSLGRAVG